MVAKDKGLALSSAVALLAALEEGELFLAYQPTFDLQVLQLRGVEALLRWRHPERGLLGPDQFLPGALTGGLGARITAFVVNEAIAQCGRWARQGHDIAMSVNVPPAGLLDGTVPDLIAELLQREQVEASALTVELTEQPTVGDLVAVRPACTTLARLGVQLSLDDFGMGDSSLSRLYELQFDEIKLDRSFVANAASDPTARHIVAYSTELAHSLGIRVVAEGIESGAVLAVLTEYGVDIGQGYGLGRPTTAEAIASLPIAAPLQPEPAVIDLVLDPLLHQGRRP